MLLGLTAGARADFLDDLFGGGSDNEAASAPPRRAAKPVRAAPRDSSRSNFSIRLNEPRGKRFAGERGSEKKNAGHDSATETAAAKLPKPIFCYAGGAQPAALIPESADTRLHDGTLRSGDSVVTSDGILVFKGHAACPHKAGDFVALAASGLPRGKQDALLAVERTLHDGKFDRQTSANEAEEVAVAGKSEK